MSYACKATRVRLDILVASLDFQRGLLTKGAGSCRRGDDGDVSEDDIREQAGGNYQEL